LIIKPHPDENPNVYERILQEEGFSNGMIRKDIDLYMLLNSIDVLFTSISMVGAEAVLFDEPIICINLTGIPYSTRYDEAGVAVLVEQEEDILPTIDKILNDKEVDRRLRAARRVFKERYAYRMDDLSSSRIVEAIRSIIKSGPVARDLETLDNAPA
jgi:CDP-glycerol glycerophosphotransferase (TagB/SpsB family)